MKKYLIGDIHGHLDKLLACLESVNFDYENDQLIQIGDVVDRGPDSYLCVEELLKIKNLVAIRGNHDATFRDSIIAGDLDTNILYTQGGAETKESYYKYCSKDEKGGIIISSNHVKFFIKKQQNYYIDSDRNLFVHGGFNRHKLLKGQSEQVFNWDRDLFLAYLSYLSMKDNTHLFKVKEKVSHIFIGHTPTTCFDSSIPLIFPLITNCDTGCGKDGLLTIMNLNNGEYKQF